MQRRALVTGGCGFIGVHLTKRLLKEGWEVEVVDNFREGDPNRPLPEGVKGAILWPMDFSDSVILNSIKDKRYDIVFHLAAIPRVAYSVENPVETTDNNILKTVKLFHACVGNVKRVIFSSSSSVYGGIFDGTTVIKPVKEHMARHPKSPYAWQKAAIEDAASIFSDLYELDIVCLRYFNVFGPGQVAESAYSTVICSWCDAIKNGKPLRLDGNGYQSRDFCYIDNVVDANILAAEGSARGGCFNIAGGDRIPLIRILDYCQQKFSGLEVKEAPNRKGDVRHTLASLEKSKMFLNYEPKVLFWEGLAKTFDWWGLEPK